MGRRPRDRPRVSGLRGCEYVARGRLQRRSGPIVTWTWTEMQARLKSSRRTSPKCFVGLHLALDMTTGQGLGSGPRPGWSQGVRVPPQSLPQELFTPSEGRPIAPWRLITRSQPCRVPARFVHGRSILRPRRPPRLDTMCTRAGHDAWTGGRQVTSRTGQDPVQPVLDSLPAPSVAHQEVGPFSPREVIPMPARSRRHTGLLAALLVSTALPVTATEPPAAPTVQPDRVPAAGRHSAVATTFAFGRYAIAAASKQGVALQLVDRMAGPGDGARHAGRGGRPAGRLPGPRPGQATDRGPPGGERRGHARGAGVHGAAHAPGAAAGRAQARLGRAGRFRAALLVGVRRVGAPGGASRPQAGTSPTCACGGTAPGWRRPSPSGRSIEPGRGSRCWPAAWSRGWSPASTCSPPTAAPASPGRRAARSGRSTCAGACRRCRRRCAARHEVSPFGIDRFLVPGTGDVRPRRSCPRPAPPSSG